MSNSLDFELVKEYVENYYMDTKCSSCKKELTTENIFRSHGFPFVIGEKYICIDCAKKMPHCENCNKLVEFKEELMFVEDIKQYYCNDCISNYTYCCFNCNKYYTNKRAYIQFHGNICKDCYLEVEHFKCDRCGDEFLSDRYGADDMCITCANECVSNCLNYTFKPYVSFFKKENEKIDGNLFMGVELECGYSPNAREVIGFIDESASSFFYMKRDASIPAYGCEIVTHPATFNYHQQDAKWKELMSCAKNHFLNSDNDHCGIHIHVNRSFFSSSDIVQLDYIINNFSDFWKKIARRESRYSAYVAKRSIEWGRQTTDRHCALNLSNRNTIEFRIFKGTLNFEILMSYLEIIYHLCNFIKTIERRNSNMLKLFKEYCDKNSSKSLKKYLTKVLG